MTSSSKRILVAEDEAILAFDLQAKLAAAGFEVIGPLRTCAAALRAAEDRLPDFALLDIHLADGFCWSAADYLAARDVPTGFMTGFAMAEAIPLSFRGAPRLSKPIHDVNLLHLLAKLSGKTLLPEN